MTILVSSVGDTFVNILQEQTGEQSEGKNSQGDTSETPTGPGEAHIGYLSDSRPLIPERELPETEEELIHLVQKKLPQEVLMLSKKFIK